MKKYFFMAVVALASLTACQKDNEPEVVINDGSIKFANLETRTTMTNSTSLNDGFTVLGYVGATTLFNNEETTKSGNYWITESKRYWEDKTTYNFFAVYPKQDLTGALDQASASLEFTNNGETDLVLAGRKVVTGDKGKDRGAAQLVFKHALSRVKFNFTNAFSSENTDVKIDIKDLALVGENKTGKVSITSTDNDDTATSSASVISWTGVTSNNTNISYMVNDEFTGSKIAEGVSMATDYKYIIPAKDTEYKLACKIKVYDDTATIREYDYTTNPIVVKVVDATNGNVTKSTLTHEAGKSYTYNMSVSSSLKEITFTVTVEEWQDGNGENGENIEFPA